MKENELSIEELEYNIKEIYNGCNEVWVYTWENSIGEEFSQNQVCHLNNICPECKSQVEALSEKLNNKKENQLNELKKNTLKLDFLKDFNKKIEINIKNVIHFYELEFEKGNLKIKFNCKDSGVEMNNLFHNKMYTKEGNDLNVKLYFQVYQDGNNFNLNGYYEIKVTSLLYKNTILMKYFNGKDSITLLTIDEKFLNKIKE
jgi:hypothetical protein